MFVNIEWGHVVLKCKIWGEFLCASWGPNCNEKGTVSNIYILSPQFLSGELKKTDEWMSLKSVWGTKFSQQEARNVETIYFMKAAPLY